MTAPDVPKAARPCLAVLIAFTVGALLFMSLDILLGDGRLLAHNLNKPTPGCGLTCHADKNLPLVGALSPSTTSWRCKLCREPLEPVPLELEKP